ncbi:MAG TPA: aromatic ring-hydroxylating dioxygenase subunit alpha [Gammaproteobacteria bacterium]|nr:aromatic ring-hydroxylating dioxygenase subunit alpha [Gammaproteobacteria bacterium]
MTDDISNKLQPDDLRSRPLSEAITLPASAYVDPAFHAFEMQHIFACSWQPVAHADQLQETGDQVVAEIAGKPIIVVRGNDGVLRGFFNVCRHRAGPLALVNGNTRQLQCKYHGWTYTLEGQLRAAHEMQGAEDLDISCIHLDPVRVGEWEGMAFAAVKEPAMSLAQLLDGISDRIRPIELPKMRFHTRINYDVACNWKVYVDNYLEGYHLPHVHPGLNRLLDYRSYTTSLSTWHSYQHSPLDGSNGPYRAGEAHYYFVYPNLMLNILPDRLQTNLVIPISSQRCRIVFDYYYTDNESEAGRRMIAEDLRFSDEVQQEDVGICERVQIGLASGSYHAGRLSPKREAGVHHFQELVRRAYRDANI